MRDGCAARSAGSGEPLHGSASRAQRWILFEHPGAWGSDVLADRTLPPATGRWLRTMARDIPARVLLIRRAPGVPRHAPHRTLFAGVTTPHGGWFERFDLPGADPPTDLDFSALGEGRSVDGAPVTDPFYLVCTNGSHDACCAEYGRPVVATLAPQLGDRLWEASHVGGDRFAGNLVCLPSGSFYGRLAPDNAWDVVRAHDEGRIDLERWRGRSSLPFPVQSAEAFARRELGLTGEDELRHVASRRDGALTRATFVRLDGSHVVVTVRRGHAVERRILTCAGDPVRPPTHDLVSLEVP